MRLFGWLLVAWLVARRWRRAPGRPPSIASSPAPDPAPRWGFPRHAAVRRDRGDGGRDRRIARWQLASLLTLIGLLTWICWDMLLGEITYTSPPLRENEGRPGYEIAVPAKLDAMTFEIRAASTTLELSLSEWTPGLALRINSRAEEEIRVLELRARSAGGAGVGTGEWERVAEPGPDDNRSMGLRPMMASPPTTVSLTLGTGRTTESSYYRFVRTGRIDVLGSWGTAETARGAVSVETGPYAVERFVTDGVSRPGTSEGSTTTYDIESSVVLGANDSVLPVPAVSIDLAHVEKNRSRDSTLLVLGAVLGVVGGTLIEILLTAAHLGASRPRRASG